MKTSDKVALITGASSGIGEGVARKLAAAGVKVGLAARRLDRLHTIRDEIRAAGGEAIAIQLDVTDLEQNKAAVRTTIREYGRLDVAVLNAGLMPLSDIEKFKVDEWQRMVDVNIKGVLNSIAAVTPPMISQKSGHIFLMSSVAGRKTFKGLTVYCATKHALTALADGMRMELAPTHNIHVTSIQPGAVATELYDHITDAGYRQQMRDLAGSMEFLQPSDIGDSVVFALQAPKHVDLSEMFIMPTAQGW